MEILLVDLKNAGLSKVTPIIFVCVSCSVMSDSLQPDGLYLQASLSMGFPKQEDWSGLLFPPPGEFFPTQRLNLGLLNCRWILYHLIHSFGVEPKIYDCIF